MFVWRNLALVDVTVHNVCVSLPAKKSYVKTKTNVDVKDAKNWQMPTVTPGQKNNVVYASAIKKIDLSHRGSCQALLGRGQGGVPQSPDYIMLSHAVAARCSSRGAPPPVLHLRQAGGWLGRLTSLASRSHPESCCSPPGKRDAVSIYHWKFPWPTQCKGNYGKCYCGHTSVRSVMQYSVDDRGQKNVLRLW